MLWNICSILPVELSLYHRLTNVPGFQAKFVKKQKLLLHYESVDNEIDIDILRYTHHHTNWYIYNRLSHIVLTCFLLGLWGGGKGGQGHSGLFYYEAREKHLAQFLSETIV